MPGLAQPVPNDFALGFFFRHATAPSRVISSWIGKTR
jgi:hypothetical protein